MLLIKSLVCEMLENVKKCPPPCWHWSFCKPLIGGNCIFPVFHINIPKIHIKEWCKRRFFPCERGGDDGGMTARWDGRPLLESALSFNQQKCVFWWDISTFSSCVSVHKTVKFEQKLDVFLTQQSGFCALTVQCVAFRGISLQKTSEIKYIIRVCFHWLYNHLKIKTVYCWSRIFHDLRMSIFFNLQNECPLSWSPPCFYSSP